MTSVILVSDKRYVKMMVAHSLFSPLYGSVGCKLELAKSMRRFSRSTLVTTGAVQSGDEVGGPQRADFAVAAAAVEQIHEAYEC